MNKETKQIITFESIKKELVYDAKASIFLLIAQLMSCAIVLAVLIPTCIFFSSNFNFEENTQLIDILFVLGEIILIAFTIGTVVAVCVFIGGFVKNRSDVKNNKFHMVEDTLARKVRQEPERSTGSRYTHYHDVFYFAKTGRYIPGHVAFELSDEDDKFYVIVFDDKENELVCAYNAKMYEWRE